jgi:hypothetical protein
MLNDENTYNVIGGDFNMYMDHKIDKYNTASQVHDSINDLKTNIENLNYIDIWRLRNPDCRRYTWRRHFPLQQSRLDYFFIPLEMSYCVENTNILPSIKTDHSLISLTFKITETKRGPGLWKFNSSLLHDIQYVAEIKTLIKDLTENMKTMQNKAEKWEIIKYQIRQKTIQYSKDIAKLRRNYEHELDKRHEYLINLIENDEHSEDTIHLLQHVKQEIENINAYKSEGNRIRAKAEQIELDEKCNKYFLQSSQKL